MMDQAYFFIAKAISSDKKEWHNSFLSFPLYRETCQIGGQFRKN